MSDDPSGTPIGFRYDEQVTPPGPERVSDVALTTHPHLFEVDPRLMERWVLQQEFPNWDSLRIMSSRADHLDWMHRHFATRVVTGSELLAEVDAEDATRAWTRATSPEVPSRHGNEPGQRRPDKEESMKFSYVMLPDYPLAESLASIKKADELGFHGVYAADETWHKDLWLLFAAAAADTSQIRMGPSVSGVVLREPTLIAQAAATLDELSNGRADVVLSSGNFGLLAQYGIDWAKTKPLSRVKEAVHVVRTLLDEGTITHHGDHFSYDGLFTFARPVQDHLPVKMGAMRGPKSFEVAAEFSDGCHHALSYTREAYDYMIEHCAIGAERAGKNVQDLDLGAWVVFSVAEDSVMAKDAARSMVGLYASSMPHEQLERNGVDPGELAPIIEAIGAGDMAKGIELTTPDLAERLSVAGTPEECTEKLQSQIAAAGINHLILAITDASLVKALMGREVAGVPDVNTQLQLVHDRVMPAFA